MLHAVESRTACRQPQKQGGLFLGKFFEAQACMWASVYGASCGVWDVFPGIVCAVGRPAVTSLPSGVEARYVYICHWPVYCIVSYSQCRLTVSA